MHNDIDQVFASGLAAMSGEDFAAAEERFRHIVALHPMNHEAWNALAWSVLRAGNAELALEYALRAHELDRQSPEYLNTLGVAHGEMGQFDAAEKRFRRALALKPLFTGALVNLGKTLQKQGRLPEALKTFERAHTLEPGFPGLALILFHMYRRFGRLEQASELLERSRAALDPEEFAIAMAESRYERHDAAAAIGGLREVLDGRPELRRARYFLSELLLAAGEWREGWQHYLCRTHLDAARDTAPLPQRLAGRPLLLQAEQGLGDTLFFLRFAPLLRARGARIALACQEKLLPLLPPGEVLAQVRGMTGGAAAADERRVALGDLPALLECDATPPAWPLELPAQAKAAAAQRLAALGPAPYLGVTWRAGTDVVRQREFGNVRSLLLKLVPPAQLGAALRGWRGTVVLLQRGMDQGEAAQFRAAFKQPAHDLAALSDDLPALGAVLACLDEYVAVSNTNVHLLAGLGRGARVLVPFPAEWRWMRRDEGGSLWFPGFAVYREPRGRGWSEPLARLRAELLA